MGKRRHEFERARRGIWEGLKRPGQGKWRHYIIISDIKGIIKTFQTCMWLCMLHAYECVGTHTWACSCRGQSRKSEVFLYHFSQRLSQTRKSSLSRAALPGSYWNSSVSSPQGWGLGSCMSGLFYLEAGIWTWILMLLSKRCLPTEPSPQPLDSHARTKTYWWLFIPKKPIK